MTVTRYCSWTRNGHRKCSISMTNGPNHSGGGSIWPSVYASYTGRPKIRYLEVGGHGIPRTAWAEMWMCHNVHSGNVRMTPWSFPNAWNDKWTTPSCYPVDVEHVRPLIWRMRPVRCAPTVLGALPACQYRSGVLWFNSFESSPLESDSIHLSPVNLNRVDFDDVNLIFLPSAQSCGCWWRQSHFSSISWQTLEETRRFN